jgi:hypothetical protein
LKQWINELSGEGIPLMITPEQKSKYIDQILANKKTHPIKFEKKDETRYINIENLAFLTSSQCQFLAENMQAITDLEQLRLSYE